VNDVIVVIGAGSIGQAIARLVQAATALGDVTGVIHAAGV
jgi:predicted dinucleotide-binding enzyme